MGTHPIFESDFDCLTERLIFFFETWVMKITLLICFLLQFVVAMTDFSKLIELKDKDPKTASGSKKQRCGLDTCMKCLSVLKNKKGFAKRDDVNDNKIFGCTMMWVWPDCCPQWQNVNFLS